jgi:hypothetical protein
MAGLPPGMHGSWNNPIYHDFYRNATPRLTPDARKPYKSGQSKGAWIWPRDKDTSGPPWRSAQRWKDLFTRKGPAIFLGKRQRYGPTRNIWSNWAEFDNLGYRDELDRDLDSEWQWCGKKYDFRTRRYTRDWHNPHVWSDVKWGSDGYPLYIRNAFGTEWSRRNGILPPSNINPLYTNPRDRNDFEYDQWTGQLDWMRPQPEGYYAWNLSLWLSAHSR